MSIFNVQLLVIVVISVWCVGTNAAPLSDPNSPVSSKNPVSQDSSNPVTLVEYENTPYDNELDSYYFR